MPPSCTDAGLARRARVGDVEALELAGAPARDVAATGRRRDSAMSVISGGTAPNGLSSSGSSSASAGSAGIVMTFSALTVPSSRAHPQPDRRAEVLRVGDDADEAVGLARVVGRAQLEDHLVLGAQVDLLDVAALLRGPTRAACGRTGCASSSSPCRPSSTIFGVPHVAGDDRAVVEVPPEVVGQLLRAAVLLPRALDREVLVVEQEQPPGPSPSGRRARSCRSRRARSGRCAGGCSRSCAAISSASIILTSFGLARIVLDVEDVDARGAQAGHDQVAALDVRVGRPRGTARRAGVPAEVVQLVADVRHVEPADRAAVRRRRRGRRRRR